MRLDRIERREEVLVDVIECETQPDLRDAVFECYTVDISQSGIKISGAERIPVDAVLDLRLDCSSAKFRLQGRVRWSRGAHKHFIGLSLDDAKSPDMSAWAEMINAGS